MSDDDRRAAGADAEAAGEAAVGKKPWRDAWDTLRRNKTAMAGLVILVLLTFVALFGRFLMPYDPYAGEITENFRPPSAAHWLGTDELGRDLLSRLIDGTRISLRVGITAVAVALVFGTVLGALAAYYGGRLDMILMRLMDVMLAIPDILLAIAIMTVLGPGIGKAIIAISFVSIPQYARIVRGCILSVKENDYVAAARLLGNSDRRVVFRHILPNAFSPIIVRATLGVSGAILDTAALGFLGLGVQPPFAEWGTMLGTGRSYIFNAPYIVVFPGLAITITVLAFNLFGDGLRDALDPRGQAR